MTTPGTERQHIIDDLHRLAADVDDRMRRLHITSEQAITSAGTGDYHDLVFYLHPEVDPAVHQAVAGAIEDAYADRRTGHIGDYAAELAEIAIAASLGAHRERADRVRAAGLIAEVDARCAYHRQVNPGPCPECRATYAAPPPPTVAMTQYGIADYGQPLTEFERAAGVVDPVAERQHGMVERMREVHAPWAPGAPAAAAEPTAAEWLIANGTPQPDGSIII